MVLNTLESQVRNQISVHPVHVDELLRGAAAEPSRVLETLTVLEMRRMVGRLPGKLFVRHD